jgi:formate/nitrite transporter FocA (FNT family)
MAYLVPSEFVTKMVDAGESKIFMSTRDTVIRAYMAGAILALAAGSPSPSTSTDRPADRSSARRCFRSASACSICSASTC